MGIGLRLKIVQFCFLLFDPELLCRLFEQNVSVNVSADPEKEKRKYTRP